MSDTVVLLCESKQQVLLNSLDEYHDTLGNGKKAGISSSILICINRGGEGKRLMPLLFTQQRKEEKRLAVIMMVLRAFFLVSLDRQGCTLSNSQHFLTRRAVTIQKNV